MKRLIAAGLGLLAALAATAEPSDAASPPKQSAAVTISRIGIAGVKITDGSKTVFIDAFAEGAPQQDGKEALLILVTHDDRDHFLPKATAAAARASGAVVAGPPTISYPLLVDEKLPAAQVMPVYSPLAQQSDKEWHTVGGVRFRFFPSAHIPGWPAIHISLLVELGGRLIYHTGDSVDPLPKELADTSIAVLVQNTKAGFEKTLDRIEQDRAKFKIGCVIPMHFHGNGEAEFAELVKKRGIKCVTLLKGSDNRYQIPADASL